VKAPDARYATAGSFLSALIGAAPRVRVIGQRVAVVSFTNLTGGPTIDTFSDGVGEEIVAALRTVDGIRVAAQSSIGAGVDVHPAEIARSLGADVLLFGDVRDAGNGRVQISAVLIDGRSGRTRWSGTVSGPCRTGLDRECEPAGQLAEAVATALGVKSNTSLGERRYCTATLRTDQNGSKPGAPDQTAAR
jgi:TolB-like protein